VKKNGSHRKLLISIGALVIGSSAGAAFEGELHAVRIYDRPLTPEELGRNRRAAGGLNLNPVTGVIAVLTVSLSKCQHNETIDDIICRRLSDSPGE
jgi:hypothetical protein